MPDPTLLIVDDEIDLLDSYGGYFTRRGFTVSTANSGNEALEVVRKAPPQIIISDLNMCNGSGLHLLRSLQKENLRPQLFAVLTGDDSPLLVELHQLKPDLVLTKPLPPSAILKAIKERWELVTSSQQSTAENPNT
jgi:two-component system response regulator GlrR